MEEGRWRMEREEDGGGEGRSPPPSADNNNQTFSPYPQRTTTTVNTTTTTTAADQQTYLFLERVFVGSPHGVDLGARLVEVEGGHRLDLLGLSRLRALVHVNLSEREFSDRSLIGQFSQPLQGCNSSFDWSFAAAASLIN